MSNHPRFSHLLKICLPNPKKMRLYLLKLRIPKRMKNLFRKRRRLLNLLKRNIQLKRLRRPLNLKILKIRRRKMKR